MQALASGCPALTTLNLCDRAKITDVGVQALANWCPGPSSLDLSVTAISGIGVQALASGCPGLTSLYLSGTAISDIGVQALASGRPGLTTLCLCDCAKLQQEILRQQGQLQEPGGQVTCAVSNQSLQLRHRCIVNGQGSISSEA